MVTVEQIARDVDTAIEVYARSQYPRVYLGPSTYCKKCIRQAFFTWRFAKFEIPSPRMLRLFNRGHREEEPIVQYFRQAGYVVYDTKPLTDDQFEATSYQGHVKSHIDGKIFLDKKTPAILEIKTHNKNSFTQLKRSQSVFVAKEDHFVQMQGYMKDFNQRLALYVAVNKDNDDRYMEIVKRDDTSLQWIDERIVELLTCKKVPAGISEDPSFWLCNMCTYKSICFGEESVNRTCRLCQHVELEKKGGWSCRKRKIKRIGLNLQVRGCEKIKPMDLSV